MNLKFSITKHFRFWDSEDKFFGLCGLEWIYVKNVKCNDIDSFIDENQVDIHKYKELRKNLTLIRWDHPYIKRFSKYFRTILW